MKDETSPPSDRGSASASEPTRNQFDFRAPGEVSWRTTLITPAQRYEMLVGEIGEDEALKYLAETAAGLGYICVCIAPNVYKVVTDVSQGKAHLELTEMRVEDGGFVLYIVHRDLTPLCKQQGQTKTPITFVCPEVARVQAARNGGEVLRADEWAKKAFEAGQKKIITPGQGPGIILPPGRN